MNSPRRSVDVTQIQALPSSWSSADRHAELRPLPAPCIDEHSLKDGVSVGVNPANASKHAQTQDVDLFFSPHLAPLRRRYFLKVGRAVALIISLMWMCLPAYWGSLSDSATRSGNLAAWFVDRDGPHTISQGVWAALSNKTAPGPKLGWISVEPMDAGGDDDIIDMILNDEVWVVVVVEVNATSNLAAARRNGDKTYDPANAITVYYTQARNEIAAANFIVPIVTTLLQESTSAVATTLAQKYMAQVNGNGFPNSTALEMLAQAPRTLTPAVSWTMVNLRPYTASAAQAVTLVGNIFICIFTLMMAMAHSTAYGPLEPRLRFSTYLVLRICVPLVIYIPLSMSYALVSLAFGLPFGTRYSEGSGFMLFFAFVYLGMAALGMSLESMIIVFTPRYVPFFLFTLIIYNVAPVVLPVELQNPLYSYGAGFPIWNLSQAIRTILFNTQNMLARNAAVIIAWIIISCGTLSGFSWITHRRTRAMKHSVVYPDNNQRMEGAEGKVL